MPKIHWLETLGISERDAFIAFVLLFNTFSWYYCTLTIIDSILTNPGMTSMLWIIYYSSIALSSVFGATISGKVNRLRFLYIWTISGTFVSLLPGLFVNITVTSAPVLLFLLGIAFGIGMPSSLSYFADITTVEKRGGLSGIIFLITNLSVLPIFALFSKLSLLAISLTSAAWRGLGFIIFYGLKPQERTIQETKKNISFVDVLGDRYFILYAIPWFLFSFIDRIEGPISGNMFSRELFSSILIIKPIIGGVFALIGGLLADSIGRKRMVVYGFIALGVAYATLGIAPGLMFSFYFSEIVNSIAAGIFWAIFIVVLWGDLSRHGTREKYYVIGNLPFALASIPPILLEPYLSFIPTTAAFSLASFFLFASVLPLMYAPETLPQKKIEIKRLKGYVEQAKKFTEKYTKKNGSKS